MKDYFYESMTVSLYGKKWNFVCVESKWFISTTGCHKPQLQLTDFNFVMSDYLRGAVTNIALINTT